MYGSLLIYALWLLPELAFRFRHVEHVAFQGTVVAQGASTKLCRSAGKERREEWGRVGA